MRNFDDWNKIKKSIEINSIESKGFPREGEVWMCHLGKNIGCEQNGGGDNFSRPVVIVKKFNNLMFWIIPLSTKQKNFDFYYNFNDSDNKKISAILAQLKLMSMKRLKRKIAEIDKNNFSNIKLKLREYLD